MLKDSDVDVQQAVVKALESQATQDDLTWLADLAIHNS
jgi:hypothetical protein